MKCTLTLRCLLKSNHRHQIVQSYSCRTTLLSGNAKLISATYIKSRLLVASSGFPALSNISSLPMLSESKISTDRTGMLKYLTTIRFLWQDFFTNQKETLPNQHLQFKGQYVKCYYFVPSNLICLICKSDCERTAGCV